MARAFPFNNQLAANRVTEGSDSMVEQVIGGLRHQDVQLQVYRCTGTLADLHTSRTTRHENRCPRNLQRLYCALTSIIQHIEPDDPSKHAISQVAKNNLACVCA